MRLRWLSILVACLACALGAARAEIIPYGDVLYVYPGETAAEPNLTLRLRGERMNPDTLAMESDEALAGFSSWAKSGADVLTRMLRSSADDSVVSMLPADLEDIDPLAPVLREEAAATLNNMLQMLGIIEY